MIALQAYYDGSVIQPLEKIQAQKNQKLIITILDEFIEEAPAEEAEKTARGILGKYARPELQKMEKTAWEKAVVTRYGNT